MIVVSVCAQKSYPFQNTKLDDEKRIDRARLAANKAADTIFNRDRLAEELKVLLEVVIREEQNKANV